MKKRLQALLDKISRELGIEVAMNGHSGITMTLPPKLEEFYGLSDGLALPFLTIYPAGEIEKEGFGGWYAFGFDHYFSYCLFNPKSRKDEKFDLWDHESGNDPEECYSSIIELIEDKYSEIVEDEYADGTLVITAIPESVKKTKIIVDLKKISDQSSSELLKLIKNLPCSFKCEDRKTGIKIVRGFHSLGVDCHLKI